jgi:WD40 repeat protein
VLQLWDMTTSSPIGGKQVGDSGSLASFTFTHDGHQIDPASRNYTIRIWHVSESSLAAPDLRANNADLWVALSSDGSSVGIADSRSFRLQNTTTYEQVGSPIDLSKRKFYCKAFLPYGHPTATSIIYGTRRRPLRRSFSQMV